jgi:hypothetical protein
VLKGKETNENYKWKDGDIRIYGKRKEKRRSRLRRKKGKKRGRQEV